MERTSTQGEPSEQSSEKPAVQERAADQQISRQDIYEFEDIEEPVTQYRPMIPLRSTRTRPQVVPVVDDTHILNEDSLDFAIPSTSSGSIEQSTGAGPVFGL